MLEDGKISSRQFFLIIFSVILSVSIFSVPSPAIALAKQEIWLAMLIATFLDGVVAVILFYLGQKYFPQSLIQYCDTILGRVPGKILGAVFIVFFIHVAGMTLRILGDFMVTAVMPETPILVFIVTLTILSASAVRNGLEVIARLSELIGPLLILFSMLTIGLVLNNVNLDNLKPFFHTPPADILIAGLIPGSWFGVCILMGMLLPYHNKPKQTLKAKMGGVVTGTVILTAGMLVEIGVFGVQEAASSTFPSYSLARMISLGDFVERIEAIIMTVWLGGGFMTLTALYFSAVLGTAQLLNLKTYKPLVGPVGIILIVFSILLFENHSQLVTFNKEIFPYYALSIEAGLTTVLLVVSLLRHGKAN
ncbi:MAG: endospore germination permease [Clostridia bacterium]|nr:endospore germination permease [Clostridia bacterium]